VTLKNSVGNLVWNAYCDVVLKFCLVKLLMNVDFWNFRFYISLLLLMIVTRFWGKDFTVWVFFCVIGRFILGHYYIGRGHYYIEHSAFDLAFLEIDSAFCILVFNSAFMNFNLAFALNGEKELRTNSCIH
jgi:hypothetical protein